VTTIEEIIEEANKIDWYLIMLCQYGPKHKLSYRAAFQRRTPNGATESVFTAYEDAPDALTAVTLAFKQCKSQAKALKLLEPETEEIPLRLEKALCKAVDANWFARKTKGAPRRTA
jgi:hypothetical protein